MCDHLNYRWKECLALTALIVGLTAGHHFIKPAPEQQKAAQVEKIQRQDATQKACAGAKAAQQKGATADVKNANKGVPSQEACDSGMSVKAIIGWTVAGFLGLGCLGALGMGFIFYIASARR